MKYDQPDRIINPTMAETDPSWRLRAACRGMDPDLFFAERGESVTDAKLTCLDCPVRTECKDYSLTTRQAYGVWGGVTERGRKRLRRAGRLS